MKNRSMVLVLLVAGATSCTVAAGAADFPYCEVPLDLQPNRYASKMTLVQLQLVTRHGDRMPQAKVPADQVEWVCEPFAGTLRFLDISPQVLNQVYVEPYYFPPSCNKNQLTSRGRDMHHALGDAMREKYVEQLGFLPVALTPSNVDQFFARSTDIARTRQSAQAFLTGLYPATYRFGNPVISLQTRGEQTENITPNTEACERLETLVDKEFFVSPLAASIFCQSGAIGDGSCVYKPAIVDAGTKMGTWDASDPLGSLLPTFTSIDNLFARVCHDKMLPPGMSRAEIEEMRELTNQAAGGMSTFDKPSPEAARLGIGSFLGEILDMTRRAANSQSVAPRMVLVSAHDTTLWPLLATLGQENDVLIPYASHMAFELWRDRWQDHWVAVELNGDYLTVPGCGLPLCKLEDFEAAVAEYIPVDYEQECKESGAESAISPLPALRGAGRLFVSDQG